MCEGFQSSNESGHCADGDCRHLAALRRLKAAVRKISHDLSQPTMVITGYVELLELEKFGDDVDSLKQVIANISGQLDTLQGIHIRLREAISPETMKIS